MWQRRYGKSIGLRATSIRELERVVPKFLYKPTKMLDVVALCENRQEVGGQEPPAF
jgi:hypothetical protein